MIIKRIHHEAKYLIFLIKNSSILGLFKIIIKRTHYETKYLIFVIKNSFYLNYVKYVNLLLENSPKTFIILRNFKRFFMGMYIFKSPKAVSMGKPGSFKPIKIKLKFRKKILYKKKTNHKIVHFIGSLGSGGAERQLCYLAIEQRKKNDDVTVLIYHKYVKQHSGYINMLEKHNISVIFIEGNVTKKEIVESEAYKIAHELPYYVKNYVQNLVPKLNLLKPDILHCWLDHSNMWGAISGIVLDIPKIILSTRNVNPTNFNQFNLIGIRETYRLLKNAHNVTITNNSNFGAIDYAKWLNIEPQKIKIIYNGIPKENFKKLSLQRQKQLKNKLLINPKMKVLLGVFRFSEEKEPIDFLKVVKKLRDYREDFITLVYGEGPLKDQMKEFVKKNNLTNYLNFMGTSDDIDQVMSIADVLLLTSRYEGTPNVFIEAQIVGCPIVATKAGGADETLIKNKTGFLADIGDINKLAIYVNKIFENKFDKKEYNSSRLLIQKRFSILKMVKNNYELYLQD